MAKNSNSKSAGLSGLSKFLVYFGLISIALVVLQLVEVNWLLNIAEFLAQISAPAT